MSCANPACNQSTQSGHFACGTHWFQLPLEIREAIKGGSFQAASAAKEKALDFWARGANSVDRQMALVGFDEVDGSKSGSCRHCGCFIVWGETDAGYRIELDPKHVVYKFENGKVVRVDGFIPHEAVCKRRPFQHGSRSTTENIEGELR